MKVRPSRFSPRAVVAVPFRRGDGGGDGGRGQLSSTSDRAFLRFNFRSKSEVIDIKHFFCLVRRGHPGPARSRNKCKTRTQCVFTLERLLEFVTLEGYSGTIWLFCLLLSLFSSASASQSSRQPQAINVDSLGRENVHPRIPASHHRAYPRSPTPRLPVHRLIPNQLAHPSFTGKVRSGV